MPTKSKAASAPRQDDAHLFGMQLDLFAPTEQPISTCQPSAHGVYPADGAEILTLPVDKPGWKGLPLAEVCLLRLEAGWIEATSTNVEGGGFTSPLSVRSKVYGSRGEALHGARRRLLAFCIGRSGKPDGRRISQWAKALS